VSPDPSAGCEPVVSVESRTRLLRAVAVMAALGGCDDANAEYVASFYRWCQDVGVDPLVPDDAVVDLFAGSLFRSDRAAADAAVRGLWAGLSAATAATTTDGRSDVEGAGR